ncbi:hypothetical protein RFI_09282 [Reticulomyxa filosa]|uniref:Uncharacterized protein n=1 Tax=Reticulomyxa filosa TaxID=46433 RepID=X6NNJ1_RETFI|nr:hypothetical protein RFI_09282 [Reticulomyxa filosa]|eukprot:ETO27850.1 hypothetical protein RFI_09282 [Reticulomyxa filosa]
MLMEEVVKHFEGGEQKPIHVHLWLPFENMITLYVGRVENLNIKLEDLKTSSKPQYTEIPRDALRKKVSSFCVSSDTVIGVEKRKPAAHEQEVFQWPLTKNPKQWMNFEIGDIIDAKVAFY